MKFSVHDDILTDVKIVSQIEEYWIEDYAEDVLFLYIGTNAGVFYSYPGYA